MTTDERELRPTAGARFALARRDHLMPGDHATSAIYDAQVVLPDQTFTLAVTITTVPAVEVTVEVADTQAAPAWTLDHLRSLARGIGRAAARGDAWPRRLLRWRAAKP